MNMPAMPAMPSTTTQLLTTASIAGFAAVSCLGLSLALCRTVRNVRSGRRRGVTPHAAAIDPVSSVLDSVPVATTFVGTATVGTATVGTATVGTATVGTATVGTATVGTGPGAPATGERKEHAHDVSDVSDVSSVTPRNDATLRAVGEATTAPPAAGFPPAAPRSGQNAWPRPGEGILIRRIAGGLPGSERWHPPSFGKRRGQDAVGVYCPLCARASRRVFPELGPLAGVPLLCGPHARRWLHGYYGGASFTCRPRDGHDERFWAGLAHVTIAGDGDPAALN